VLAEPRAFPDLLCCRRGRSCGGFASRPVAIPERSVLHATCGEAGAAPGREIDRGSERLNAVFLPKLEKLCAVLATWAGRPTAVIVLLTNNARRCEPLRAATTALPLPVVIEMLPRAPGHGDRRLQKTFSSFGRVSARSSCRNLRADLASLDVVVNAVQRGSCSCCAAETLPNEANVFCKSRSRSTGRARQHLDHHRERSAVVASAQRLASSRVVGEQHDDCRGRTGPGREHAQSFLKLRQKHGI